MVAVTLSVKNVSEPIELSYLLKHSISRTSTPITITTVNFINASSSSSVKAHWFTFLKLIEWPAFGSFCFCLVRP
jgi:hypothetical protein